MGLSVLLLVCTILGGNPDTGRLTPRALDALLGQDLPAGPAISDEAFLRRVSLDLIGRPPTPEEMTTFLKDSMADKRARLIERLLASPEYGRNWADYWSDTISYRVSPPELTFLNYKDFKSWLAGKLNAGTPWDQVVREILTASGKLQDNPAATFIAFHQADPVKLGSETARVFLALQLQCAQCHDHKFDHWKREEFHHLAACFVRVEAKLTQKDAGGTIIKDKGKGEYVMPNAKDPKKPGQQMEPTFLTGEVLGADKSDAERREFLARMVTRPDNPWFARAYVNRIWARLMGRGFYEPVDDLADYQKPILPQVHKALAAEFVASNYDSKALLRLVMNTEAYQRQQSPVRLRGDQVFAALVAALQLPNLTPPAVKPTEAIRFPPPPKCTAELVAGRFGFDPSLKHEEVSRTMGQAMMLMNNTQIQAQINADPKSGTPLSKLLQQEAEDRTAVVLLFQQVLARKPTEKEIAIALEHVRAVGKRGEAFEDILWGLVNSAEFTSKR